MIGSAHAQSTAHNNAHVELARNVLSVVQKIDNDSLQAISSDKMYGGCELSNSIEYDRIHDTSQVIRTTRYLRL